jgi:alpha-methylacyl-CoA racemase
MSEKLLEGITIIDFSHRLPGPFAGHVLANLGAKVYKVEDQQFKDSFLSGAFSEMDQSFAHWYEELNGNKEILRFNFKDSADQEKIRSLIKNADGVILSLPDKIKNILGLDPDSLEAWGDKALALIEPLASMKGKQNLHDINALAESGLLSLHLEGRSDAVIAPPFLPLSGIGFGHKIATDMIAAILKSKIQKRVLHHRLYLFETTLELFSPFWPKKDRQQARGKFLHNGLFPCYNLYRLKDGNYAALAAVEEKFWRAFCQIMELEVEDKRRFDPEDKNLFKLLADKFQEIDSEELLKISSTQELCLSLVKKIG